MKTYTSTHFYAHLEFNPLNIYLRVRCFKQMLQENMYHIIHFPVSYITKQASLFIVCIFSALIYNSWQGTFQILAFNNAFARNCQFHARTIYKQASKVNVLKIKNLKEITQQTQRIVNLLIRNKSTGKNLVRVCN